MSNDSTKKTLFVALGVCLVCSVLVSTAAVTLKSIQEKNKEMDKLKNILSAGDLYSPGLDIKATYAEKIDPILVDLQSGKAIPESEYTDELNPADFDIKNMAKSSKYGKSIPADEDLPDIKRMPRIMTVFQVKEGDHVSKFILPMYGKGLWSTMYGFMALDADLKTIKGFTFYEHGETPGLGGEVDNPRWKRLWVGKKAFDDNWQVKITVLKGLVDPTDKNAQYKVDGLSGSTLTTRGIDNLIQFWLGESGYGNYLESLRASQSGVKMSHNKSQMLIDNNGRLL